MTYLAWSELADLDRVARTSYLAPSFARDSVVTDPDGRLARLREQVAPLVGRPDVVRDRWEALLERMAAPPRPTATWAEAVTGWLFPTSLPTLVVLVAAQRNTTVRLRYLRSREVLTDHGLEAQHRTMLAHLGCGDLPPDRVLAQLPALAAAFDAAAARGPTSFFFASDVTPDARPVAVQGTASLVGRGDHREAVFWLLATFSRCVQILDATGAPDRDRHAAAFAETAADLAGVRTPADLARRRAAQLAWLPELHRLATRLSPG